MGLLALSGGDVALIILAAFWGLLVLFIALVMVTLFRVLESTKGLIDGITDETVPLIGEFRSTVQGVNKELDRVDGLMASAGKIGKAVERITLVVEQTVSSPLIKIVAFSAGAARAMKRFRGEK